MFLAGPMAQTRTATDDFWYGPAVRATAAGALVSSETAMRLSTVYKCVRAIAETRGMLPVHVYRRLPRGKDRAPDHPLMQLLKQPNPWQTAMQWAELMQGHASLLGNGYSEIVYDGAGRVDMLLPLHPQRTTVEVLPNGMPRYRTADMTGRERVLVFGQVFHLMGFSTDGYRGMNPVEAEREAIGSAITARDFGSSYFGNSARPPMWIEHPGKFASAEARDEFVTAFRRAYTGHRNGTVPVMDQGLKLHALSLSPQDSQWMEARKYHDVDICGLWRVPPHKIGIYDQMKWANVEQADLEWVSGCILPWARRWEQALQMFLDFGEDYFPEILIDALLRGDTKTRYEAYGKGIQDGWLTRNEARERENLNQLDGLDDPLEPLNMAPAGSRAADTARGVTPSGQRAAAILHASAQRVARKEVAILQRWGKAEGQQADLREAFAGHARFVAEVMALDQAAADAHLEQTLAEAPGWKAGRATLEDIETHLTARLMRLGS